MKTLLIAVLCIPCMVSAQYTLTLRPGPDQGKDAKIWSLDPIVNYGDFTELRANAWTWDGEAGIQRSFIAFNLANIPPEAEICYAYLSLYKIDTTSTQINSSESGPNTTMLRRIITPWEEDLVTWISQPSVTMVNHVIIPESVELFEDVLDIDVTELIADMVADPANSFGFQFSLEDESYYRRRVFATSDFADSTHHPKLEVCYTLPGVETSDIIPNNDLSVFPNPVAQGPVHITYTLSSLSPLEILLCDALGRIIYTHLIHPASLHETVALDINQQVHMSSGMYSVILRQNGETTGNCILSVQ